MLLNKSQIYPAAAALLCRSPTFVLSLCKTGEPWGSTGDGRGLSNKAATLDMEVGIFVSGKRWAWH